MARLIRLAAALGVLAAFYAAVVRQRMLRWGATDEEADGPFPCADLIPGGTRSGTMAITIDAPPDRVWPWLTQMGYGRAGWYSWDALDNFGHRSASEIHPEWVDIKVGDRLAPQPGIWEVVALEPERFLGLRTAVDLRGRPLAALKTLPRISTDSLWAFQLKPLPEGRTRLIVSGYWAFRPSWLQPLMSWFLLEPEHWIMQTRQFANLKHRVEHDESSYRTDDAALVTPSAMAVAS